MSWYRRTKLVYNSLRSNLNPRITPKSPISDVSSRIHPNGPSISAAKCSGFSSISSISISRKGGLGLGSYFGKMKMNPFMGGAKRSFYVDRYQVHHFKPRGPRRWFQNPRGLLIVVLVGSGVVITVYFGNLETVPYTKRSHFILLSKSMEKQLGEAQFKQMKHGLKGKILPAMHPESVRVRLIARDIITALQRGLSHEHDWHELGYASMDSSLESGKGVEDMIMAQIESSGKETMDGMKWSKEDEILDDKWIQQSRKRGQEKGSRPMTSHLEGLRWEVILVNDPLVNALCLPAGKIVVFTGLLEHFRTDAEIATVIGHEVGHAVARHVAEKVSKDLWFTILQLVLYQFIMPNVVNTMSALLLRLPFSRKMEMEADYIGLLLLASAGYDPRVAPKVYEKLGELGGGSDLKDYLSTHPSGKKRAQVLAQAKVMQEALMIYGEVHAGHGIQGFL